MEVRRGSIMRRRFSNLLTCVEGLSPRARMRGATFNASPNLRQSQPARPTELLGWTIQQ
jgi:hypothetical protein